MDYEADFALGAIRAGINRIEGLYSKFAQKHEIPYGVAQVLYVIKLNSPVTQKQISEICEIPKQTVNGVIRQLEADRHITLTVNSENKREKTIALTPLGEAYTREILQPLVEINQMLAKRIGLDSINEISKSLALLCDALEMEIEFKEVSSKWEGKIQKNITGGKNS